jgi:hypothetical protein
MSRRPRIASRGACALCKSTFDKSAIRKHLQSCMGKTQIDEEHTKGLSSSLKFFHLLVEGHDLPEPQSSPSYSKFSIDLL